MDIAPIGMSHTRESVSTDGHNKVATDRVPTCDFVVFVIKQHLLGLRYGDIAS